MCLYEEKIESKEYFGLSWLYSLASVKTPQGDAMENWEQVHRLRKRLFTLATLARSDGQQWRIYTHTLLWVFFSFCQSLLSMELDDGVLAENQTLSNPSPSITHHELHRGERKEQLDEGLVKVKHGHQSTLANLHPPHLPPVCCCRASCQLIREAHKWYLKTLRPLKGGWQGETRKGSV